MIQRPQYTQWLESWRDKDVIKVVTGMRRSGKSTIFTLFQKELLAQGVPQENIISLNFESLDEEYPREAKALYSYIASRLKTGKNYVFLDEIQHVEHFETAVDALYVKDDVDVYITGSNAFFLSGELATLLTGRYVEKRVMPFSFAEYVQARGTTDSGGASTDSLFDDYLMYGGLPLVAMFGDDEALIHDYLAGVFSTIVTVDIAQRAPQMNMRMLFDTASFLADNIGSISSLKSISNSLKSSGRSASPTAVADYVGLLIENFLLYRAQRFDVKGKEYLSTLEKYYVGDLGFRFWLLGKAQGDIGHRIENVAYLELLRRYMRVDVGKVDRTEVDFVARDGDNLHYYQVSASVLDAQTRERELKPLKAIKDNHPKFLLTLDRVGVGNIDGIQHINLIDWLLERQ